ncbi:MAG: glycosyltransferase family 2 protein [Ruminococcaceae bacterium]|nr:glycosyltransferase family 2 protein [Oscillospiraceae bacterium]
MEKVSVIIPAYNVERFIRECVNSVREQTYKNLEIIIVDDGSSDGTLGICQKLASEDDRIKIVNNGHGGVSRARNAGLDNVTGELIVSVDSDDVILPDMIETLYNKMLETGAEVVACGCRFITEEGEPIFDKCPAQEWVVSGRDALASQDNEIGANAMIAAPWGKLTRKEVYDGKRYKEGIVYEDRHLMPRLYYGVSRFAVIPYVGCLYRQRNGSIMHTSPDSDRLKLLFDVLHDHIEFYIQVGDSELEYKTRKHILDVILTAVGNGVPKELKKCVKKEFRTQRRALGGNLISKRDRIKYFLFRMLGIKGYKAFISRIKTK